LAAVGVAAGGVDGTEDGFRVVGFHEGAGAVVDGFAGEGHVVGVHDAVDEADLEPFRNQGGLAVDDGAEEVDDRGVGRDFRVVALAEVVGEGGEGRGVAMGGGPLEGADADVAGGDAGEDGARELLLAEHRLAGGGDGEAAGSWDAEGVHGLADEVFPEHRAESGATVATAGERGAAGAFELDVETAAVLGDLLAEEDGTAIAEAGEVAELVAGVGLGDGLGIFREEISGEKAGVFRQREGVGIKPEFNGERGVEDGETRRADRDGEGALEEQLRELGVGVVEVPSDGGGWFQC
jgi:hypothetical protein